MGECGNCRAPLTGPFCSQCGEKKLSPADYSLRHFVEETVDEFTHLDSRLLRTMGVLLAKPGQLSIAYFQGGRSRYTKPLTLFLIINIAFFFIQPHTGLFGYKYRQYTAEPGHLAAVHEHLRQSDVPDQSYIARFDANLQNQKKSLLIVAVPVLAVAMTILFAGSGRTYAEHLVMSVQVYAFLLAYLVIAALAVLYPLAVALHALGPAPGRFARTLETERTIDSVLLVGLTVYMYLGFRRAYQTSRVRSAINAFILACTVGLLIGLYHNLLFYVALWTT